MLSFQNIILIISAILFSVLADTKPTNILVSPVGETCDDCYDISLTGFTPDRTAQTGTFSYEIKIRDPSCSNIGAISLGLDNNCGRTIEEIEQLLSFEFSAPSNSIMITLSDIVITDKDNTDNNIIEINIRKTITTNEAFKIIVSGRMDDENRPEFGDRTKRGNTENNLFGFVSTNGKEIATCFTDITYRPLPEICRPPRGPPPPQGEAPPPPPPGNPAFKKCGSECENIFGECADELDPKPQDTTPCADEVPGAGQYVSSICVEVREDALNEGTKVTCSNDEDCEGQDRCFTLVGANQECNEMVCGSSNWS